MLLFLPQLVLRNCPCISQKMMLGTAALLILLELGVPSVQASSAKMRIALVIGNAQYEHASRLKNPDNDADLMEKVLRKVGFKVDKLVNGTRPQMLNAMLTFGRSLRQPNTVGLFYYAGHGIQINGLNYLIPVDANLKNADEVRIQSVDVSQFLQTLDSVGGREDRLNIVILDACRNNPFSTGWRSVDRGLAPIDSPSGTIVAFATAPGEVAYDGAGNNSPYTLSLAQAITTPGQSIEQTFKVTRSKVWALTHKENKRQIPWETTSLIGDFYFVLPQSPGKGAENKELARLQTKLRKLEERLRNRDQQIDRVSKPQSLSPGGKRSRKPTRIDCVQIGNDLSKPIGIKRGIVLCEEKSGARAKIVRVAGSAIAYKVNGGPEIWCGATELCGFDWPKIFLFNVRFLPGAAKGQARAELVPYRR